MYISSRQELTKHCMNIAYNYYYESIRYNICNSYITGARSVSDLLHWSPRAEGPRASCKKSDADRVAVI